MKRIPIVTNFKRPIYRYTGKTGPRTLRGPRIQNPMRTQDPMGTQEPMRTQDPMGTQDHMRTQNLIRTKTLWGPRTLRGLRTLWIPRILWRPRAVWGLIIFWWPTNNPETYKLAEVSWFPYHVFNLVEFTIKGRFIYHCWMQINLTFFVKLKIC